MLIGDFPSLRKNFYFLDVAMYDAASIASLRRTKYDMEHPQTPASLAEQVANGLRQQLLTGDLRPGQHLSEVALATQFNVSRNTLREAFRLLSQLGLLIHEPNRGVFVNTPTRDSVVDIYRVRRVLECQALHQASRQHSALEQMEAAFIQAQQHLARKEWQAVGTVNMQLHRAIVTLNDSPRLDSWFADLLVELRLVFGMLPNLEQLHVPYVAKNMDILQALRSGNNAAAVDKMLQYLQSSEDAVLQAYDSHVAP